MWNGTNSPFYVEWHQFPNSNYFMWNGTNYQLLPIITNYYVEWHQLPPITLLCGMAPITPNYPNYPLRFPDIRHIICLYDRECKSYKEKRYERGKIYAF